MPRPLVPLCCAVLAAAGSARGADQPPRDVPPLIGQLTVQAGKFWGAAPSWYCRETLRQRAPDQKKERHGLHFSNPSIASPAKTATREIVSWYGFSSYAASPEAIHEVRQIAEVDGKPLTGGPSESDFRRLLVARDDNAKHRLAEKFEAATLSDAPLDFGQLVMLFTRRSASRYTFTLQGKDLIGAQRVTVFQYSQQTGTPALHLNEKTVPLAGTLSLREPDGAPVRITVAAVRKGRDKAVIRDEADVDYQEVEHGVILPASLVHRHFVDGTLQSDDRAQYLDWKAVPEAKMKDTK